MTALLELPAFRQRVHPMSVETYHRLGEMGHLSKKVELLRGIVVTKMPKSPLHELVAQKLMSLLLVQVPEGFEVRPERPLTLRDSEPEPGLSVVRGRPDDWVQAHPGSASLVVEIAVSHPAVDEGKAEIYAEAGIPEYWLVRPGERTVDAYSGPTRDGYLSKSTLKDTDTLRSLRSLGLPSVGFAVGEIFPAPR